MTKIVVSLRSAFQYEPIGSDPQKVCTHKVKRYDAAGVYLMKSIEYLNFRQFSHFLILGIL
jgi:hypothetical protein